MHSSVNAGIDPNLQAGGPSLVVVGPGWLGHAVAAAAARAGWRVWGLRRTPASEGGDGVHPVCGDVATSADDPAVRRDLPPRADALVLCTAPSRARGEGHADSYPAAAHGAVRLARALGARSLLYTSSTGVYGVTDGRVVTEGTPVTRGDARTEALVRAEETIREAGGATLATGILRVAGLYGPGRDPSARFRDPALLSGGDWWTNFAWRDDVVSAVLHLLGTAARWGPTSTWNCADGHPMPASAIVAALRGGTAPPPGATTSGPAVPGRSNQRIDVGALRATGWVPQVPDVLAGLRRLGALR